LTGAEWFYVEDGRQAGPVPFDELRARAVRGDLERPHLVWSEGMPEWQAAETVPGLFDGVEEPPTAGPPTWRPGVAPPRHRSTAGPPGIVIWGFVLSIIGVVFCQVLGIVGIVLCAVGLPEAKRRGSGAGLAIAGIVIGICGIALMAIMIVVNVVAVRM